MEEGDIILCKVAKVTNTMTSVTMPNGKEGIIISPEIAAGRIKFMRQYVVPNKQIVCKILKIENGNVNLSLRRVSSKEKKEVFQKFKQTQAINIAFKQILGDDEKFLEKILEKFESLLDFTIKAKSNPKLLQQYIPERKQEAIAKIINKKGHSVQLRQNIKIECLESDGITRIKKVFELKNKNAKVIYISAGILSLKLEAENFKEGKKEMLNILEELKKRAKENICELSTIDN